MIKNTNIKILLTLALFLVAGFYVSYSLKKGMINVNLKVTEVSADVPTATGTSK